MLGWINTEPNLLKTYVPNRIAKIQDEDTNITWGHVPSLQNPADLLFREVLSRELKNQSLWWNGPPWLNKRYPQPEEVAEPATELPEMKTTRVILATTLKSNLLNRYSSFAKLS